MGCRRAPEVRIIDSLASPRRVFSRRPDAFSHPVTPGQKASDNAQQTVTRNFCSNYSVLRAGVLSTDSRILCNTRLIMVIIDVWEIGLPQAHLQTPMYVVIHIDIFAGQRLEVVSLLRRNKTP